MNVNSGFRYVLPHPIDLNSASREELVLLRGIGANYAKRIIEQRPYCSVAALETKARIPNYVLERIRDQLTFGQPSCDTSRSMLMRSPSVTDRHDLD